MIAVVPVPDTLPRRFSQRFQASASAGHLSYGSIEPSGRPLAWEEIEPGASKFRLVMGRQALPESVSFASEAQGLGSSELHLTRPRSLV